MKKKPKKISCDGDLLDKVSSNLWEQLKDLTDSWKTSRGLFCLHCVNFILAFIAYFVIFSSLLNLLKKYIEAFSFLWVQILIQAICLIFLPALFGSNILSWKTFFKMDRRYSLTWFKRLFVFDSIAYSTIKYQELTKVTDINQASHVQQQ